MHQLSIESYFFFFLPVLTDVPAFFAAFFAAAFPFLE